MTEPPLLQPDLEIDECLGIPSFDLCADKGRERASVVSREKTERDKPYPVITNKVLDRDNRFSPKCYEYTESCQATPEGLQRVSGLLSAEPRLSRAEIVRRVEFGFFDTCGRPQISSCNAALGTLATDGRCRRREEAEAVGCAAAPNRCRQR